MDGGNIFLKSDEAASESQIPVAGTTSPPIIPEWHSSKRGPAESIEELQAQRSWRKPSRNRSKGCQQTVAMTLSKSI